MRWAGIDEAGYGPNLGPLVLSAVVADTRSEQRPDLWSDPAGGWCRAGAAIDRLWLDDSKAIYQGGHGLDRLEAATLAVLADAGLISSWPVPLAEVVSAICGCSLIEIELSRWLEGLEPDPVPSPAWSERVASWLSGRPRSTTDCRIVAARSLVLGPESFNDLLGPNGLKTAAHGAAFARVLRWVWEGRDPTQGTFVRVDKHGGRHYYADLLARIVPETDVWIRLEGPTRSEYELTGEGSPFLVEFAPKADADDGLVALASILSKTLREHWMRTFNAFWQRRVPELRPTAGYPADAKRFRDAIEPLCRSLGLEPSHWWRRK